MLLGTIMLLLVAGIAFYHYVQGFFSSMLSAVLTILAAVVAVSYHEPLAEGLLANALPNQAHAVALVGLFAIVYVFSRLLTDRLIPGNIRLHVLVEKIGAGACGVVAGIFATGILTIAAQLLPIGPSIAAYSRYPLKDREVNSVMVPGKYRRQDLVIYGELDADSLNPNRSASMFPLPVDEMTLGLVSYLSHGSLAGRQAWRDVHPSYPDELFAHRLGPFRGGDVLISREGAAPLSVMAVYSSEAVLNRVEDFERKEIRGERTPRVDRLPDQLVVVVRASMEPTAGGANALNMGSVRLVVDGENHFPVGSYQGNRLLMTRPDDILMVEGRKAVDYVFLVSSDALVRKDATGNFAFPPGAFIQAKRAARVDLGGRDIAQAAPNDPNVGIVEKDKSEWR